MWVDWSETALDGLADIYVTEPQDGKPAVATAAAAINAQLASDPMEPGESRSGPYRRIWFVGPLMVMYDVFPPDGIVVVTQVGRRRTKS